MTAPYTTRTVAEDPELARRIEDLIGAVWPSYFIHAPPHPPDGRIDWGGIYRRWPHLQIGLLDGDELIASANTLPLHWDDDPATLPDAGWNWAMRQGLADFEAGLPGRTLCGLAATVARHRQGEGLSREVLRVMRAAGRAHGMERLIVPVRPPQKDRHPHLSMADYAAKTREDGLHPDPWVRTHQRLGARIIGPCSTAMCMSGSRADWSAWLGADLPESGAWTGPTLLAPLQLSDGVGIYTEPNLWMIHET